MWFDGRVRTQARPLALAAGALALWAIAKYWSLVTQVWRPNEYSDAYYYFLQCQKAASGGGLAGLLPEYPTPAAALLYLPYALGGVDHDAYRWTFLVGVVAVDALFVAVLLARGWTGAVVAWTVLETLSGRLALLRFDVLPAVLGALAVASLLRRRDAEASVFVVAGAAVKAWPAILAPLTLGDRRTRVRALATSAISAAVVAGASIAAAGWDRLLSPLFYQRDRGLQIEAVAATTGMLARLDGSGPQVVWTTWNAYELAGPGVQQSLANANLAAGLALVAFVGLGIRWLTQGSRPDAAAHLALFATSAFMVTSKALSPQYLLWLAAPVVVVLAHSLTDRRRISADGVRAVVSFVLVGVLVTLTAYLYPLHYDDLLAGARRPTEVLAVRNVGLLVFMAWSGAAAWAAARSERGSRGPAATG